MKQLATIVALLTLTACGSDNPLQTVSTPGTQASTPTVSQPEPSNDAPTTEELFPDYVPPRTEANSAEGKVSGEWFCYEREYEYVLDFKTDLTIARDFNAAYGTFLHLSDNKYLLDYAMGGVIEFYSDGVNLDAGELSCSRSQRVVQPVIVPVVQPEPVNPPPVILPEPVVPEETLPTKIDDVFGTVLDCVIFGEDTMVPHTLIFEESGSVVRKDKISGAVSETTWIRDNDGIKLQNGLPLEFVDGKLTSGNMSGWEYTCDTQ